MNAPTHRQPMGTPPFEAIRPSAARRSTDADAMSREALVLVERGSWTEIKGFEMPKNRGIFVGFSRMSQKPTCSRGLHHSLHPTAHAT